MASLENNNSAKHIANNTHEETGFYEEQANLIDYFLVLWKHKWFIALASVLPTLIIGTILFLQPKNYEVTYVYDIKVWNIDEINYNILTNKFYSEENISKITQKLQENGFKKYAKNLAYPQYLEDYLKFESVPAYIDIADVQIIDAGQLENLRQIKAQLLKMTIIGNPKKDICKISAIVTDNLQNITSVYTAQKQLSAKIMSYKSKLASIEQERFNLALRLKTNKSALKKFKNIDQPNQNLTENKFQLQFDIGGQSQYLPLANQTQALESVIINIEKAIETNEGSYTYYKQLLNLNEKLFAEIEENINAYYTIQQYHSFLTGLVDGCKSNEVKDYLKSYIKDIENKITATIPITEKPAAIGIARGTVKKSLFVFAAAMVLSILISFLLEGLKQKRLTV